jgi:hypothetical protein
MKLSVVLRLSRVSNLPTVWTNVLAGVALAGGNWNAPSVPLVLLSLSLFYTGGMFLNDAFDREFDARVRPERPIPAGEVSAPRVFGFGFGMLGLGLAVLLGIGMMPETTGWEAAFGGLLLCIAIVLYDANHKTNPLSPLVMGLCRMLVYMIAALAVVARPGIDVYAGACVLLCYLCGLTYAAKKEHLNHLDHAWPLGLLGVPILYGAWFALARPMVLLPLALLSVWTLMAVRRLVRRAPGDVLTAVVALLAGISLLDAVILAGYGQFTQMALALAAFALTLGLQDWISGT